MRYFKNVELARLYDISEKTVRNWLEQARDRKLDLELFYNEKSRPFIANTTKNNLLIEQMVASGKKYRNSRTHKIITPTPEFYEIYTEEQVIDIISNLSRFHEFPFHYCHMGKGAKMAADYYDRLKSEVILNPQSFSAYLLSRYGQGIIDNFEGKRFNIVELGGRSGLTISEFVKYASTQTAQSYIDIDVSSELLQMAEKNLSSVVPDIKKSFYQRDFVRNRFDDLLISGEYSDNPNLVCLLGGTLHAFNDIRLVLNNIRNSLMLQDYFIVSAKLDSDVARRYFDFNATFDGKLLPQKEILMVELLGLDDSFYSSELFYDEADRARKIQIRLKFDITLRFTIGDHTKDLVFAKGDTILLWRFWHQTMPEMIEDLTESGFEVVQAVKSPDEQYAMVISRIKVDKKLHR